VRVCACACMCVEGCESVPMCEHKCVPDYVTILVSTCSNVLVCACMHVCTFVHDIFLHPFKCIAHTVNASLSYLQTHPSLCTVSPPPICVPPYPLLPIWHVGYENLVVLLVWCSRLLPHHSAHVLECAPRIGSEIHDWKPSKEA
jgi:hypothetical protein